MTLNLALTGSVVLAGEFAVTRLFAKMTQTRLKAAGVRLRDGRILVAGGQDPFRAVPSAEIYDPRTGSWTAVEPMHYARYDHAMVLMEDGRVMAAGGRPTRTADSSASAEIFDPRTGHWTIAASMNKGRDGFSLADVGNLTLLAAGGNDTHAGIASSASSAELYDARTDHWTMAPPLPDVNWGRTAAKLKDGRVLLLGGNFERAEAAIYSEDHVRFDRVNAPSYWHEGAVAATMNDGRVLLVGGTTRGNYITQTLIYNPKENTWISAGPIGGPRRGGILLRFGELMALIGGENGSGGIKSVEVFDPKTYSWRHAADLKTPRIDALAFSLDQSQVLAVGGLIEHNRGGQESIVTNGGSEIVGISGNHEPYLPPINMLVAGPVHHPTPLPGQSQQPMPLQPSTPLPGQFLYDPAPVRRGAERPHDYAVIVGIDYYKSLPHADFAERDAVDVSAMIASLGVPEENIVTLTGSKATLSEFSKYVGEWLPKRVTKESRVYFYFSGHGGPDVESGTAYLMPWDADAAFIKTTGFPLSKLYEELGALPAPQVIAFIDACFSGSGGRSVIAPGLRPLVSVRVPTNLPPRVSVLAAAEKEEAAGSLPERAHGLFSYYMLQGLGGAADAHHSGHVTLEDLYVYVHKRVIIDARERNWEQTPTLISPDPSLKLY